MRCNPRTLLSNQACTQVVAPYLIILRVAKRRAMTSESISGSAGSVRFQGGETDTDGSHEYGGPTNMTEVNVEAPGDPGAGDKNIIKEVPLW